MVDCYFIFIAQVILSLSYQYTRRIVTSSLGQIVAIIFITYLSWIKPFLVAKTKKRFLIGITIHFNNDILFI